MKSTLTLTLLIAATLTACNENDNADKTESAATIVEEVGSITAIEPEDINKAGVNTPAEVEAIASEPASEVSDSMSDNTRETGEPAADSISKDAEVIKEKIESVEESVSNDTEIIKDNLELIHENEVSNTME